MTAVLLTNLLITGLQVSEMRGDLELFPFHDEGYAIVSAASVQSRLVIWIDEKTAGHTVAGRVLFVGKNSEGVFTLSAIQSLANPDAREIVMDWPGSDNVRRSFGVIYDHALYPVVSPDLPHVAICSRDWPLVIDYEYMSSWRFRAGHYGISPGRAALGFLADGELLVSSLSSGLIWSYRSNAVRESDFRAPFAVSASGQRVAFVSESGEMLIVASHEGNAIESHSVGFPIHPVAVTDKGTVVFSRYHGGLRSTPEVTIVLRPAGIQCEIPIETTFGSETGGVLTIGSNLERVVIFPDGTYEVSKRECFLIGIDGTATAISATGHRRRIR